MREVCALIHGSETWSVSRMDNQRLGTGEQLSQTGSLISQIFSRILQVRTLILAHRDTCLSSSSLSLANRSSDCVWLSSGSHVVKPVLLATRFGADLPSFPAMRYLL